MSFFTPHDERFPLGIDRGPERLQASIKERAATQCLVDKVCRQPRTSNGICAVHNAHIIRQRESRKTAWRGY